MLSVSRHYQDLDGVENNWLLLDPGSSGPARIDRLFITSSTHASQVAFESFETRVLFLKPRQLQTPSKWNRLKLAR